VADPAAPRGPVPGTGRRAPGPERPEPGPRAPNPGLPNHASPGHRPPATGHASVEDPPPFGHSWPALYTVVAGTLLALIVLFAVFTRAFE
jgi:hypothetical protein